MIFWKTGMILQRDQPLQHKLTIFGWVFYSAEAVKVCIQELRLGAQVC